MRKLIKSLHTLASCGLVGGLLASIVLLLAPTGSRSNADSIALVQLSRYLIFPSLAVVLVTGLLAMVVHRPFQGMRWVWLKAFLGITVFEATLGVVAKANDRLAFGDYKTSASFYEICAL